MSAKVDVYEKLGAFYLGRPCDPETGEVAPVPLLYDSKDLVTHAVCVGMTGSGKTGLCIGLLEEAAIDGIPSLVIDVKGDLGNLMLNFPKLRGEDFRHWIDEDEARRKGVTADEFATQQAELWKQGLADWDQGPERIRRLRESAEFAIYTPGSETGLQVSILSSFAAPPEAIREDGDALHERIATTSTSLLGLLGIDADPIRSREHILISNLLDVNWRQGKDLDLASLIQGIQDPPFDKVGMMPLESFYPAKERFELAMAINNLLAAPTFQSWLVGEPLDVDKMLFTAAGKPRVAIFTISHLADAERMFFVSLLLNQTLSWMRGLTGTSSLRAIVYMDEIFGYLPPVANPPSKRPLLTMLRQARAFGVGLVLATQNPVDLDYKALSNIGTWFLGRLQTERHPQVLGAAKMHFVDTRKGLEASEELVLLAPLTDGADAVDWDQAREADLDLERLDSESVDGAAFATLPEAGGDAKSYSRWSKSLDDALYRNRRYELLKSPAFKLVSVPGERERDFRIRLADVAHEQRDEDVAKLRARYAKKIATVEDRVRRAEQKIEKERGQASREKLRTAVTIGTTLLGALFGRRRLTATRIGTATRGIGRSFEQSQDVGRAQRDRDALVRQIEELNRELEEEIEGLGDRYRQEAEELETFLLKPRRSDVDVRLVALAWVPYRRAGGGLEEAWG